MTTTLKKENTQKIAEMNTLPSMPHYMNLLEEYTFNNFLRQGLPTHKTRFTSLTITLVNGNAVFKQKAEGTYGRKHFSCWRIFHLAKMIQDEGRDSVKMLKIRIEFESGQVSKVKYVFAPSNQE